MSYNNTTAKAKITLTIKKIQVLWPITFKSYKTPQKIEKSIDVLGPNTFKDCNTYSNKSKFKRN